MARAIFLVSFITVLGVASFSEPLPPYKNPALPVETRLDDLIARMTLEEKVAQLMPYYVQDPHAFDEEGNFVGTQDTAALFRGVGVFAARALWRGADPVYRRKCINGIQRYLIEKTRLGIPALFFNEALHGLMSPGATSFPQAIALGCTWDTTLVEQVYAVAAIEARAEGTRQVLSPVLDLARDPRWGRTEECFSEDPYLASRMGMAAVYGFQGRSWPLGHERVVATLKHFAGHGQPEGGRNIAPVNYSEREFRLNHLYPFEMAVKRAGALSIMASYNEWDGVPNHVNKKLLTDILRGEWGFLGYVMSDGGGMDVTYRDHRAVRDSIESGMRSILAGVDYDLSSRGCFRPLTILVRQGLLSEETVTRAARNVLRVKFLAGLFDDPFIDPALVERVDRLRETHRGLALKAAHEAMVLLKNDPPVLPLDSIRIKRLAVIGPNAAEIHLGGYSPRPMHGVSVLEGIRAFAQGRFEVVYAKGCELTLNPECHWLADGNPILNDPEKDRHLIAEAVKLAKRCDAVVLVLGENEMINREAWSETHLGDRDDLDLVGSQNALAMAILALGKPTVVVLINGRPITINAIAQKVPAILECWYLGQETGHAVAHALFGRINPSGKLSVTFPRSVGQLPCFYNHKPSRLRSYVLAESSAPLFPFGFGLSYTSFAYQNLRIMPDTIPPHGTTEVSIEVTNTGDRPGDEIVQLYIRDVVSLPTRPVQELKDFARISLAPGETRRVVFSLTPEKLASLDLDMQPVVQPGDFEIRVGKSSVDYVAGLLTVR